MLNINHPLFSFTVINHNRSMLNKKKQKWFPGVKIMVCLIKSKLF